MLLNPHFTSIFLLSTLAIVASGRCSWTSHAPSNHHNNHLPHHFANRCGRRFRPTFTRWVAPKITTHPVPNPNLVNNHSLEHPLVLPIVNGNFSSNGDLLKMHPSIVLVVDYDRTNKRRRFILIDTGLPLNKRSLISSLYSYGVRPSDIDSVVITHMDTDTVGNLNLFPCAEVFASNRITKENTFIEQNPPHFESNRSDLPFHKLFDNTELYMTPGYGLQDRSVLVHNVENHGTVAIVGKLILNEMDVVSANTAIKQFAIDDVDQRKLWMATRREIVCLADYIIPGHGAPFKVSAELKRLAECKQQEQLAAATTTLSPSSPATISATAAIPLNSGSTPTIHPPQFWTGEEFWRDNFEWMNN